MTLIQIHIMTLLSVVIDVMDAIPAKYCESVVDAPYYSLVCTNPLAELGTLYYPDIEMPSFFENRMKWYLIKDSLQILPSLIGKKIVVDISKTEPEVVCDLNETYPIHSGYVTASEEPDSYAPGDVVSIENWVRKDIPANESIGSFDIDCPLIGVVLAIDVDRVRVRHPSGEEEYAPRGLKRMVSTFNMPLMTQPESTGCGCVIL